MYTLESEVGRWSFKDGYQIYSNVVWLSKKEEANDYKLIDDDGNSIPFDLNKCLKKVEKKG